MYPNDTVFSLKSLMKHLESSGYLWASKHKPTKLIDSHIPYVPSIIIRGGVLTFSNRISKNPSAIKVSTLMNVKKPSIFRSQK